jgi:hypothetical protein
MFFARRKFEVVGQFSRRASQSIRDTKLVILRLIQETRHAADEMGRTVNLGEDTMNARLHGLPLKSLRQMRGEHN